MNDLSSFHRRDLEDELRRRDQVLLKPSPVESPNFQEVVDMCQIYIDDASKKGYVDDGLKQYIFEGAMTAVFGEKIFEYVNKVLT